MGNAGVPVIAPFWADVDTRGTGSGIVRYGTGTVDGRNAFGVNWPGVGYFASHTDKLNTFQLIMIDRSDRAPGAFDVEFNYDSILWETGDASGGTGGLGGFSARAGFSDGTVNDLELLGSGVNSGFLNSNPNTGLINNSRNSSVLGRYIFQFPTEARVTAVEYEQIATDDLPIDGNPNAGGGLRIFPDDKIPDDPVDRRRIRVKAQYGENTAGVRIYFRNFDLDDPSASSAPIDDEPFPNAGDDNNGNVDGTSNTRAGLLSAPQGSTGCLPYQLGISCLTDSSGVATVDFTTTMGQGDNFAVAASANETYLTNLVLAPDGINLRDTDGIQTPVTTTFDNACETESVRACRADMLTVWRRLHIEYDSMGVIDDTNHGEGVFRDTLTVPEGEVTLRVWGLVGKINRYQGGSLKIGNLWLSVTGNVLGTVTVINKTPFDIETGQSFIIFDDDDFNDNDGLFPRGDANEPLSISTEHSMLQPTDGECGPGPNPASCNVLAPAYIRPVYDLDGDYHVPFALHLGGEDRERLFDLWFTNKDFEKMEDFWAIYLLNAYQPEEDDDNDPDYVFFGFADPKRAEPDDQGLGVVLFLETNRPREYEHLDRDDQFGVPPWRDRPVSRAHELAREVGRMFGGVDADVDDEDPSEKSLMAPAAERMRGVFNDLTLSKIRERTNP